MKVIWTPEAEQDRIDIWDYIAADDAGAASRMDQLFNSAAARLADFPLLGRVGKISGTREMIPHETIGLCMKSKKKRYGFLPWSIPLGNGHLCGINRP